jgi:hypothetical protein
MESLLGEAIGMLQTSAPASSSTDLAYGLYRSCRPVAEIPSLTTEKHCGDAPGKNAEARHFGLA